LATAGTIGALDPQLFPQWLIILHVHHVNTVIILQSEISKLVTSPAWLGHQDWSGRERAMVGTKQSKFYREDWTADVLPCVLISPSPVSASSTMNTSSLEIEPASLGQYRFLKIRLARRVVFRNVFLPICLLTSVFPSFLGAVLEAPASPGAPGAGFRSGWKVMYQASKRDSSKVELDSVGPSKPRTL